MKLAKVVDVKSGGSTTQEFLEMAASNHNGSLKRMIAEPGYDWEEPNADYVAKMGLGVKYTDKNQDRLTLAKKLLCDHRPIRTAVIDWRTALSNAIKIITSKAT
jgi:hypothetical protein